MAATVAFLLLFLSVAASDDLQTLLQIKSSFQHSADPSPFDSWKPNSSACEFQGITCNSGGLVTGIELSYQNLSGTLPVNPICQLKSLEKLSLGFNQLTGPIPDSLNNCSSLKYLDLGNNVFSGPFPDISSITGLVTLYANMSGFTGVFPWNSLQGMKNLQVLSLGDNTFDRTPFPPVILTFVNLFWLYMSNCGIEGEIPEEIGNLTDLIDLEFAQNYISGEIPRGITKLKKLWQLELYSNTLTGELPIGLGNLSNLEYFDASMNNLQGNLSEIRLLSKLKSLQLFENNFSGEIPSELGEFKNLVNLSLYANSLTGPLPLKLGSWAEFIYIDVSQNFLTGPIPPDMCKRGTMVKLLMLDNDLTGEIPGNYANCTTLVRFRVNQNRLTGQVPGGIWGLPRAQIIDLGDNELEGPVSSDISSASSLAQLLLVNNRFSGELPPEISNASSLISVDLCNNQFSGQIPEAIGELKQLTTLQLQGNNFSGPVPASLGSCRSINDINMAQNRLSGSIPKSLGSLPALNFLNLSRNQLSGPIPASLSALRLNILDLSQNRLSGPIPTSLLTLANNGSFSGNSDLCSENLKVFKPCSKKSTTPHIRAALFILITACVVLLVVLLGFWYTKRISKEHGGIRSLKDDSWYLKSYHVLTFTEDEILDSIKQENLIGKGGSGKVYKAVVGEGKELAVKHIWHSDECNRKSESSTPILHRQGPSYSKAREFESEVQTLSSIRHKNVVKLFCSISSEDSSLLVYEYMPNGSLWDRLHECKKFGLDWETRHEIALGSAKGLEYLHHGVDRAVIHRDVKSSNILLDEDLKPRIADFGLAKIMRTSSSLESASTQIIAGTHGYIAPEYAYTNKVNEKSDLYSFGVVLMELVTGRRPIEAEFGENKDIVDWVSGNLKTRESVVSMVDEEIEGDMVESAIRVLKAAIHCTARVPTLRPTMRDVVHMLEEAHPCHFVSVAVGKGGDGKDCGSK